MISYTRIVTHYHPSGRCYSTSPLALFCNTILFQEKNLFVAATKKCIEHDLVTSTEYLDLCSVAVLGIYGMLFWVRLREGFNQARSFVIKMNSFI